MSSRAAGAVHYGQEEPFVLPFREVAHRPPCDVSVILIPPRSVPEPGINMEAGPRPPEWAPTWRGGMMSGMRMRVGMSIVLGIGWLIFILLSPRVWWGGVVALPQ